MPFKPHNLYLHGGPRNLAGGRLRRYGRSGQDAGALFFSEDTPAGRVYAASYAAWGSDRTVWVVRILLGADQVFDYQKASHRTRLMRVLNPQEWVAMSNSARTGNGQIDWPYIDEEQFGDAGFRGVLLAERSAGYLGSKKPILSVAVFDANDVQIVGELSQEEIGLLMRKLR